MEGGCNDCVMRCLFLLLCCQGDTIDDLCRPEYDDKLEELKQLSEVSVMSDV